MAAVSSRAGQKGEGGGSTAKQTYFCVARARPAGFRGQHGNPCGPSWPRGPRRQRAVAWGPWLRLVQSRWGDEGRVLSAGDGVVAAQNGKREIQKLLSIGRARARTPAAAAAWVVWRPVPGGKLGFLSLIPDGRPAGQPSLAPCLAEKEQAMFCELQARGDQGSCRANVRCALGRPALPWACVPPEVCGNAPSRTCDAVNAGTPRKSRPVCQWRLLFRPLPCTWDKRRGVCESVRTPVPRLMMPGPSVLGTRESACVPTDRAPLLPDWMDGPRSNRTKQTGGPPSRAHSLTHSHPSRRPVSPVSPSRAQSSLWGLRLNSRLLTPSYPSGGGHIRPRKSCDSPVPRAPPPHHLSLLLPSVSSRKRRDRLQTLASLPGLLHLILRLPRHRYRHSCESRPVCVEDTCLRLAATSQSVRRIPQSQNRERDGVATPESND